MDRARFELVGNIGSIEYRQLDDTRSFAIVSIATNARWETENGDTKQKTSWHRVAVFSADGVELLKARAEKGVRLSISGTMRMGSFQDARGARQRSVELVVNKSGTIKVVACSAMADQPQA